MKRNSNSAFTLVELIVVITILAILGTISFISLQGYSADARDSSRVSDVNHIKTSLELFSLASGKYPLPDNPEDVTYSGGAVVVWKQGTVGDTVTSQLSRNLNSKPTDPLYETEYVYSTLENGSKYEVMSVYESLAYNNLPATVRVDGTYNGLYVKSGNYIIPTPSIITSLDPTNLDFNATTIASQVIDNGANIPDIGTSKVLQSTGGLTFSTFEVYNGTLTKDSSTGSFLGAYNALANTYSGSSIENNGIINSLLTQTNDEEKINFTKTVVLNTTSAVVSNEATTNFTCDDTSKPTDNGHISFTVGTPSSDNQAYIQDASNCGYSCTDLYTGTSCETAPALITSTDCTNANWIWVASDVYIGSSQGSGFCISPRVGDFAGDTNGNGISFNGWGNKVNLSFGGWDSTSIDDSGNLSPESGQTKRLDSSAGYTCKSLGTSSTDFDTTDNIVGRMKWLATNKVNLTELQDIEWVQNATPPNSHPIPALFIADCIDGVKDLGTTMTYTHNNDSTDEVTYAEYSTDVTLNTDTAYLSDTTYQNRQKYLTAWTQETGSHLPSAMSYISSGYASASDADGDFLTTTSRGEYQVACEASLLTGANDNTDNERIWTSAIGSTTGTYWGRTARIVGSPGCGAHEFSDSGNRNGSRSARFVVRP